MPRNSSRVLFFAAVFGVALTCLRAESQVPSTYGFFQIGAFREAARAEALSERLRQEGFPVHVLSTEDFVRILAGPYCEAGDIEAARRTLVARGYQLLFRQDSLVMSIPTELCAVRTEVGVGRPAVTDSLRVPSSSSTRIDSVAGPESEPEPALDLTGSIGVQPAAPDSKPEGAPDSVFRPTVVEAPRSTFGAGRVVAAARFLHPSSTLYGSVKDAAGRVMPGVSIELFHGNRTVPVLQTVTDAAGRFAFGNPLGDHRIAISVPGFSPYHQSLLIVGDMEPVEVVLVPEPEASSEVPAEETVPEAAVRDR